MVSHLTKGPQVQLLLLSFPQTVFKPGTATFQQLQPLPQGILPPLQSLHPLQLEKTKLRLTHPSAGPAVWSPRGSQGRVQSLRVGWRYGRQIWKRDLRGFRLTQRKKLRAAGSWRLVSSGSSRTVYGACARGSL